MNKKLMGLLAGVVCYGLNATLAHSAPLPVTNDLWDTSNGTTVTAGTAAISGFALSNMFGTTGVSTDAIFSDSASLGPTYFVEWQTPADVTIGSFNLFLGHDRGAEDLTGVKSRDARARGISKFELFADTGGGFTSLFTADAIIVDGGAGGTQPGGLSSPVCPGGTGCPDPIYGGASLSGGTGQVFVTASINGAMTISADLASAVTASAFRGEFTRFGVWDDPVFAPIRGPRVIELDGFVPLPAAVWFFGSGLIALFGIARRKKA